MKFSHRMCVGVKRRNLKDEIKTQCQGKNPSQENVLLCQDLPLCPEVSPPDRRLGSRRQLLSTMSLPGPDGLVRGPCHCQFVQVFNANSFRVYNRTVVRINRENIPKLTGLE